MKRLTLVLALSFAVLAALAAPLTAAPRGHRGGGRRAIVVRPSWGWGFGPYWYDPYFYGYGYGPYNRGYGGRYGYGDRPSGNWAVVDTDVSPEGARVYLDGKYIGTADDFDGFPDYLYLRRGRYRLEFRLEGFQPRTIEIDARPGVKIDVGDKLPRIAGAPRYGEYDTPEPRGGVRRFWAKRSNASVEVTDEDEIHGDDRRYYRERRDADDDSADDRDRDREWDRDRDRDRDGDRRERIEREDLPREEWRGESDEQGDSRILFEVRPDDASISIDDRFVGRASELDSDGGIAIAPGRHTIVVSRPGYRERRIQIDVSRGETENVEITLER